MELVSQSKKVDIGTASARLQADLVIKVLEMMRGEEEFNRLFEKTEKINKTTEDLLKQKEIDYEIRPAKISRRSMSVILNNSTEQGQGDQLLRRSRQAC